MELRVGGEIRSHQFKAHNTTNMSFVPLSLHKQHIWSEPLFAIVWRLGKSAVLALGSKMENKRVELIPFEKEHFEFLNKEIPDSKFLMQWAGPKYNYPLTWEQMKNKIDEIDVDKTNRNYLFSVIFKQTLQIVGHVQLSIIDPALKIGNIGSVMIFNQFRNNGLSKEIIKEILKIGFSKKGMEEIRLAVFDFNLTALNCYKNTGFRMFEYNKNAVEIENEKWNSIRMKIMKSEYQKT